MKKKVLALLLAVLMAVSLLPTAAWAADEDAADGDVLLSAPADGEETELPTSGECGENLTWTYAEGVLTISGEGAMEDYELAGPWYEAFYEDITSAVISDGVTSIGRCAFAGCENLTSVTIPDSVTAINRSAFFNCFSLSDVAIPDGVTSIEYGTFAYCASLTEVTIPKGVTSIGEAAFFGTGLTEVTIPESVTSVGNLAFYLSALTSVVIPATVTEWGDSVFAFCDDLTEVTISEGVGVIPAVMFANTGLTEVVIPDSVTAIEGSAFNGTGLTSVTIPENVTTIGSYAFNGTALTEVTIPANVAELGENPFSACASLTAIEVAEENTAFCSVDGVLFDKEQTTLISYPAGKDGTTYVIPESVTAIGPYAFDSAGLTEVTIPSGVTSIGEGAFMNCAGLTSIIVEAADAEIGEMAFGFVEQPIYNDEGHLESVESVTVDGLTICGYADSTAQAYAEENEIAFQDIDDEPVLGEPTTSGTCGENLTWSFVDGVLTIEGEGAMYDYDWMENLSPWSGCSEEIHTVVVNDGVTTIGMYAFQRHFNLISATIPGSVTSIGQGAFLFDSELAEVNISEGVTEIGLYAFQGCSSLTSITIPSTVTAVSDFAFYQTGLTSVIVPATVTDWGIYVFAGCANLTDVTISEGVEIITDWMFGGTGLTEVVIPDSVTAIGDLAFNSTALTSVTIPASVTKIGTNPFVLCADLTAINVAEENPNFSSVDGVLFDKEQTTLMIYPAAKGTSYDIPDSVTEIGVYAFYSAGLTDVTIPEGVTSIGAFAFYYSGLTAVTVPASVTEVGEYAFGFCADLVEVTIPEGVAAIGDYMFYATGLTEVSIPASVTDIGMGAFAACTSLTAIEVAEDNSDYTSDDGVLFNKDQTEILAYPAGKDETSYSIPASVTAIGAEAFDGCASLTGVTIPDSVTSIGDWAFQDCASLADVTIPTSVTYIGEGAFYGCSSLTEAVIPDGVTEIPAYTFFGCANLTSVTIPDSVTFIGTAAFSGCDSLTDIYYGGTPEQWGEIYDDGENDLLFGTEPHFITSEPEIEFSDVAENDYFFAAVRFAVENGLFKGDTDGNFNPHDNLTRAETFVILGRLAGAADIVNDVEGVSPWYKNAVEWGVESGISKDGARPEDDITREELAVMLYRLAGEPYVADTSVLDDYPDSSDISSWAVEAMAWAVETGILQGDGEGLKPQDNAERAEAVTMINRYYENIILAESGEDEVGGKDGEE